MKQFILLTLGLFSFLVYAQDRKSIQKITNSYNKKQFKELAFKIKSQEKIDSIRIRAYLKANNLDSTKIKKIHKITEGGLPLVFTNGSVSQLNSTNTNLIIDNNTSGLNLTGTGMTTHLFDGDAVKSTHQEFEGRVINAIGNTDIDSFHPTAVAGVMAAKGIVPDARGMANKLNIIADTYNRNDLNGQINTIAQDGSLVSNHSYGFFSGWDSNSGFWKWWGDDTVSTFEDYKFGYYSDDDEAYDNMIYTANYHTMVKASSNDKTDGPEGSQTYYLANDTKFKNPLNTKTKPRSIDCGSGFDCIPTANLGKNIITVGAVDSLSVSYTNPSQVKLAYFSSVGPTDDGRIKPDVVAVGVGVFMPCASSNNCYDTENGTSFASPSVAGIVTLLQELYHDEKDSYMRSDMVKALLINTANEAGNANGPDYKFGWGLVDAYRAAQTILNEGTTSYMTASEMENRVFCSTELYALNGTKVKVSVAWIDEAGTPIPYGKSMLNNRTKMLVNDLDISIVDVDNPTNVFYPWVLDVNNPNNAATKGNNRIDNVEQIEFTSSNTSGKYKLILTHKGILNNPVKYAVVSNAKKNNEEICELNQVENSNANYLYLDNEIHLLYAKEKVQNFQFSIYDYTGRVIHQSIENNWRIDLKTFNLTQGPYIAVFDFAGEKTSVNFYIK